MQHESESWYSRPMDAKVAVTKLSRGAALVGLSSAVLLLSVGCDQSDAQAKGDAETAAAPESAVDPAPAEAEKPAPASKSSYQESAFKLRLEAPDSVEAGKESRFTVILEAQSGYKVNDEYPIKFQFADAKGVAFKEKTVRDAKLETKRAEMPLSVTIQSKGKHEVSGKLSFSVCTDERCLIEKRDLSVTVDAS